MRILAGRVIVALALMLVVGNPRSLHAQTTITAGQSLDFGQLVPGTPKHILPSDVINRAEFTVSGKNNVIMQFVLPTYLQNARGARIPIAFSATDALVDKNKPVVTDPNSSFQLKLTPGNPTADIMLGGTVQPVAGQLAGSYTATITLMIVSGG
jgi:hypothetical protein